MIAMGIFTDVFFVIVLAVLITLGGGIVFAVSHFLRLLSVRAGTLQARAEAERDLARHQQKVAEYTQTNRLLQITSGEEKDEKGGKKKEKEKAAEVAVEDAEMAYPRKKDIQEPFSFRESADARNNDLTWKTVHDAEDAELVE